MQYRILDSTALSEAGQVTLENDGSSRPEVFCK